MGMKNRPKRMRVTFTEDDAKEIYDQLAKSYVGHGALFKMLLKLGKKLGK